MVFRVVYLTWKVFKFSSLLSVVRVIGHFADVCSVSWPLNRSEAGGHLYMLQLFLVTCKWCYSHANKPVKKQESGKATEHTTVK